MVKYTVDAAIGITILSLSPVSVSTAAADTILIMMHIPCMEKY
jgi:hypothetical protein